MMMSRLVSNVVRVSLFALLTTAGACVQAPVPINLDDNLGKLEVLACEAQQSSGVISFDPGNIMINSGTFAIDIDTLTITETGGAGKIGVTLGQGCPETLSVTARVAPAAQVDTVCESTDDYGPYVITLNDDLVPTAISPASITLSSTTTALLNAGSFSICLEVVSPVSGTIDVQRLILNLGL